MTTEVRSVITPAILREAAVLKYTGLSRPTLYRHMDAGTFPKSIPLGDRARGWLVEELDAWVAQQRAKRDAVEGGNA